VAGAPPDPLNELGQIWGNPLYDWEALARDGYRWWTERLRRMLGLFDAIRIDHFRGFASYWAVPVGETAREGHWAPGPRAAVFEAAERGLGVLPVIVEDLGMITPDVHALRDALGFPGMAVMIWAFLGPEDNPHRLENHRVHQVVCTSTHDTDTLAGAFPGEPVWPLIELALSSRAALAMVPVQDILELGSEGRMNRPGEVGGNWDWRLQPGQLGADAAGRLLAAANAAVRA
jgi:4-alpha-glucanotransferase